MKKMIKKAKKDKELALAIIGQAIVDEADIGLDTIKISLVSKDEAKSLWDVTNRWDWVNNFRRFKDTEHKYDEWGFTIKTSKRKEIYDAIKPLPNPDKDKAFQHLVKHDKNQKKLKHGLTKNKIVNTLIKKGPMTARNIMYMVDIGYSALKEHLNELKRNGVIDVIGKNVDDVRHSHRRQANLWSIQDREKAKRFLISGFSG